MEKKKKTEIWNKSSKELFLEGDSIYLLINPLSGCFLLVEENA